MIPIMDGLEIASEELTFTASRSRGPGGQNVNKVETRVTLHFDVIRSASLTEDQKRRLLTRLRTRINKDGVLRVSSQQMRTQLANREAALDCFVDLVRHALTPRRPRKKTSITAASRERRLEAKKRRGRLKAARTRKGPDEE
jgi:ribosome-associated protein